MKLDNLKNKEAVISLAVSPDGKWLAAGQMGDDMPTLTVWDTTNWKCVAGIESEHIFSVSFNRHSDTLAYAAGNDTIGIFDLKKMEAARSIPAPKARSVCYARHKDLLLVAGEIITVLDQDDKVVFTYDEYKGFEHTDKSSDGASYNNLPAVAVFCKEDDSVMITGNNDNQFSVYDLSTGKRTEQLPGGAIQADDMITDKAEKYVFLIARIPYANLVWKLDNMERVLPQYLNEEYNGSSAVSFHPSSRFFVTGNQVGQVAFRDISDGKFLLQEVLHKGEVNALAFSADGKLLISGGNDGIVCLTDISSLIR
jgi:WD40 repeat protein